MGPHEQRLRVGIADAADAAATLEILQILFKFGPERGIFNIVDLALKADLLVVDDHAAPPCTQVRMIVHAEKYIQYAVLLARPRQKILP